MVSHDDGRFSIKSLDPKLLFRVLVIAEGLEPVFLERVDPAAGPVSVKLTQRNVPDDPRRRLQGHVVDSLGNPVVGAMVSPFGCKTDQQRWWGSMPGVDPLAITNLNGEFLLTCEQPAIAFDLRVSARGLATRLYQLAPTGELAHRLQLTDGVTVTGRVLKDGVPIPGAEIGLVQVDREIIKSSTRIGPNGESLGNRLGPLEVSGFVGVYRIATDQRGEFMFRNVVADQNLYVYGLMSSLKAHGAIAATRIHVGTDKTATDIGELVVSDGHRLSGRVVLEGDIPIPAGTRILVSRENAWDSQVIELDADGQFVTEGLPTEAYQLALSVKGYRLAEENRSFDRMNGRSLLGRVDRNLEGIKILMVPGDPQRASPNERVRTTIDLSAARLQGAER